MKTEVILQKVYRTANNALYFDDSHDYSTALWEILCLIRPGLFENDDRPDLKYIEEVTENESKN